MLPETKLWQQFYAITACNNKDEPERAIFVRKRFLGLHTSTSDVLYMGLAQAIDTVDALRAGLIKWRDIQPPRGSCARPAIQQTRS